MFASISAIFQLNPTNLAFYKCINKILQYYENKCKQYYVKMMHIMNSWCLSAGIILLSNKSGILLIFSDHETIPSVSSNIGEQEGPLDQNTLTKYNNVTAAMGGQSCLISNKFLKNLTNKNNKTSFSQLNFSASAFLH